MKLNWKLRRDNIVVLACHHFYRRWVACSTYDSATLDTLIVRRSNFIFLNEIKRFICSMGLLLTAAPDEPLPWLLAPRRYAFFISISVVFTQPGIGRWTSQNARSCESSTLRSSLSRFLSTLLCASALNFNFYQWPGTGKTRIFNVCRERLTCININSHFLENIFWSRAKFSAS